MVRLNRGLMFFRGNGFGGQGKKGGEPASNGARYAEYGTHDFDKFYINDYPFILLETYKLFGVKILYQVCKTILDYKY